MRLRALSLPHKEQWLVEDRHERHHRRSARLASIHWTHLLPRLLDAISHSWHARAPRQARRRSTPSSHNRRHSLSRYHPSQIPTTARFVSSTRLYYSRKEDQIPIACHHLTSCSFHDIKSQQIAIPSLEAQQFTLPFFPQGAAGY